jgi:hypothetical protein
MCIGLGWPQQAMAVFPWSRSPAEKNSKTQWYSARAADPPGVRQKMYRGKAWPPYARPTGPEQLPVHKFHASLYWPNPYRCYDRAFVKDVSKRQIENGWMRATTLYEYHFDIEKNELNRSGRRQLQWILQNTTGNRRVIYLQTANSGEQNKLRQTSVEMESKDLVAGKMPPIKLRRTMPIGRPATEVRGIGVEDLKTQIPPRITSPLGQTSGIGG